MQATINQIVRDFLIQNRPDGLPETVMIRAAGDKQPLEKPCLVVSCENPGKPHPRMSKFTLTLTLETRADEQNDAEAAAWHQAAVNQVTRQAPAIQELLRSQGIKLVKMVVGVVADALGQDERTREYVGSWEIYVR